MKKTLLVWMISLAFLALPAYGADSKPSANATGSPEQIASQVKDLLTKERIYNAFDMMRRMQEGGVTWQPQLCAPSDLAGKLTDEQLRIYAGIKLCDAVYAATFLQRKAVAESVEAIEQAQEKLKLRSYADISAKYFTTLKKAAADPQSVDLRQLLDQVAADFVQDIPALMSNPETADYLLNVMYGFTIEYLNTMGFFYRMGDDALLKLNAVIYKQPDRKEWYPVLLNLFKSFDRMNETMAVSGGTIVKVKFVELVIAAQKAYNSPATTDAEKVSWGDIIAQYKAVRTAVLTPSK